MIKGIGTDIVGVNRFADWVENPSLLKRYFHPEEIDWCASQGDGAPASFAVRFAAREAFGKALGTGLGEFPLKSIYVKRDKEGRPSLELGEQALASMRRVGARQVHLSLSHERDYAVAMVVLE